MIVVDFTLARIAILYGACLPRLSLEAFFCAIKSTISSLSSLTSLIKKARSDA